MEKRKRLQLYTDGSCFGNPGPGGYAAILRKGKFYKEIVGGIPHSTNNVMELTAVIKGLETVRPNSAVTVYSDSQYVVAAVNERRLEQWKQNGWRRIKTGEPVKNADYWIVLCNLIRNSNLDVKFVKLRAHKANVYNNRADYLARTAAQTA